MNKIREKVLLANKKIYDEKESERIRMMMESLSPDGAEWERIDEIFSLLSDPAGRLLDLGAGIGWVGGIGQKYFKTTYAVDISWPMVKEGGGGIQKVIANVENIPFRGQSFSAIVTCGLLHHLVDVDFVFAEAYRVLKTNGVLYIENEHQNDTLRGLPTLVRGYRHYRKKRFTASLDGKLAEFHRGLSLKLIRQKLSDYNFRIIKCGFHWYDDDKKWLARLTNFLARKISHRFGYCFFIIATKDR